MKLSKPVMHGENEITEITMREPSGQDLIDIGYPYLIMIGDGDEQSMKLQAKTVARYIATLGALPPSVVAKISLADLQSLTGEVMSFFGVKAES